MGCVSRYIIQPKIKNIPLGQSYHDIQHEGCNGKEYQMLRKLLLVALLLAIVFPTQIFADSQNSSQFVINLNPKALNGSEPLDLSGAVRGSSLGSSRIGPFQMGETIYDYQHNGSMGRQVVYDFDNNMVHFDWTWDNLVGEGVAIKYNAYDGSWEHGSGSTGGLVVSYGNGSYYCNIDLGANGRSLISHHEGVSDDVFRSCAGIDILPPAGAFGFYCAPSPGADGVINCEGWETGNYEYNSAYIWPKAEFDICDGDEIVHMIATESPPSTASNDEIQTIVYYRGTANATTGVITWPSCGMAVDSVYTITALVRENPLSDEVAISWLKPIYYKDDPADPCGLIRWQNDVMVWKSDDCGMTWDRFDIENITDYLGNNGTIEDVPMAYTDHSMLYDSDGYLHIVWNTPLNPVDDGDVCAKAYATRMWHWSDAPGRCISLVYDASTPRSTCDTGGWNVMTSKMNISECDGNFYVSFTRFGAYTTPDGDTNADCSEGGFANGEIFLTASTDGGETWGEAVNLTNTQSDECAEGDCYSEHWSSMAKYSTTEVHIQYIEDKDAGGFPLTEGEATENPVMYLSYDCFTPDPYCNVSYSPLSIGYPNHIAPQGGSGCTSDETTTFTLTLQNAGNQSSAYSVTPNETWITRVGGDPLSGTINAGCYATKEIEIQLGPIVTEGVYTSSIDVTVCGETETIPVELYVYCLFYEPEYEYLETSCWSVGVWSVGRAGLNVINELGNMYWYMEEVALMYDEGVVVSYDDTTNTFFSMYYGSDDDVDFVATGPLETEMTADYEKATGYFATPDTNICGVIEYYAPYHPDSCFMIEHVTIMNCDDVTHVVSIGEGIDFDIPDDDDGYDNRAGMDETRQMFYMMGPVGAASENYYGGVAFDPNLMTIPGGMILNNDTWVYGNSGYEPAEIGGLLNRISGFDSTIDSVTDNGMFFAIHQEVTLEPGDSIEYCKVKTSSLSGLYDLQDLIDAGFQWAEDHEACGDPGPDCDWGNADGIDGISIDDVIYLIQFIYADGPAPDPLCNGDVNGDCLVSPEDIRYLVEWIYSGGPAPVPSCPYPEAKFDIGEVDTVDIIESGMTVGLGQSFSVPVLVSNDEGLVRITLNLYFDYSGDSGLLAFDGIEYDGTRLGSVDVLPDRTVNSSGFEGSDGGTLELEFAITDYSDSLDVGSGEIAYLQFTAQGEGTVSIDTLEGCGLVWYPFYIDLFVGATYELGEIEIIGTSCTIETDPVFIASPLGTNPFKVRLRQANGDTCLQPFGATVEILDYGSTVLCELQDEFPILNPIDPGTVDGDLTFTLAAGGTPSGCTAKVTVARDQVIEVPVVSVDYDGDLLVEPSDFDYSYSDLNGDGVVDDNDLYIFYGFVGEACDSDSCSVNSQSVYFELIDDVDDSGDPSAEDTINIVTEYHNNLSTFVTLESFDILGSGFGFGSTQFNIYSDAFADVVIPPGGTYRFEVEYEIPSVGLGSLAYTGSINVCSDDFYVENVVNIRSICNPSLLTCFEMQTGMEVGAYVMTFPPQVPPGWAITQEPDSGEYYGVGEIITVELCHTEVTTALDSLIYKCYLCDTPEWSPLCVPMEFKAAIRSDIGDADCNCFVDIDDVVFLIDYLFTSGPAPCAEYIGDCNANCFVDIDDVVYLINYLFQGGPVPEPCPDQDK